MSLKSYPLEVTLYTVDRTQQGVGIQLKKVSLHVKKNNKILNSREIGKRF